MVIPNIQKALSQFLVDEEIVSDEEVESIPKIKLKRLEFQEQEREHESQLCIKELKYTECKVSIHLKMKQLVVGKAVTHIVIRLEKLM